MSTIPILTTPRLRLRPFTEDDVDTVVAYCSDFDFAKTTASLPWPYTREDAIGWIEMHQEKFENMSDIGWAIDRMEDGQLIGSISLRPQLAHKCAEIGYGIYVPYWNNGYATEAAREVIRFGFEAYDLSRIESHYFACNPSSGRVMEKCGMVREGVMKKKIVRFDQTHDTVHYAILRENL